jgi:dipeptidyl aminopeptidase/acylaminoacyl peptidase
MKFKLFITLSFLVLIKPIAQEKILTLEDLVPGGRNYNNFRPENIRQLQWCGDNYIYTKGDSLISVSPDSETDSLIITLKDINAILFSKELPEIKKMPSVSVYNKKIPEISFLNNNYRIHLNIVDKKISNYYLIDEKSENHELDFAGKNIAFRIDNNVYILYPDGKTVQVTDEKDKGIVCGKSVHQNEFGINKGLFWSPEGNALAFYRMDESMVTDYPIVNIKERVAEEQPIKYPMAGMKSHEVTVGLYRLSDGKTIWLKTGLPKEKYLTNIAWSPDEKYVYIAELNRGQDTCSLVRYNAESGERDVVLFTETNGKYVEPQVPPLFLPGNDDCFIWQSQRDGFNHLYLYNLKGSKQEISVRQLTSGKWIVNEALGFDSKGENIFFTSTKNPGKNSSKEDNALELNVWKLNIKTGKPACLNSKAGYHYVSLNSTGTHIIDQMSSGDVPGSIDIISAKDGKILKNLLTARNPFAGYTFPKIETGVIKAADNKTDLHYRLITPPDMDQNKKYPVIIYVYGGPHAQLVTDSWLNGAGGWDLYMALKGYVIFTVDGRGSSNRGFEFESIIHRHLGEVERADQIKGVDYLKTLPFVDGNRIGVFGWSYGGFMTTNLMTSYPGIFKVGVAGGPVMDWNRYEIMYGERYMDHPDENPEGYKDSNLLLKAKNLKGRLLLIHGAVDPVVVWQHSLLFLDSAIKDRVYPDYFVYPESQHNVYGKDRVHLYEKITRYFDDFL